MKFTTSTETGPTQSISMGMSATENLVKTRGIHNEILKKVFILFYFLLQGGAKGLN
jgi:hypothetical protein